MAPRKPFLLRINPELWSELESWAQEELRSINGQIEYILKQAVARRKGGNAAAGPKMDNESPGLNDQ
jgi:hypothetical protein